MRSSSCTLPHAPSWQDARRSDLYRLRIERGWTLRQIADHYGVCKRTVGDQCRAWGLLPDEGRERRESQDRFRTLSEVELRALYHKAGISQRGIAARFGVGKQLVADRLLQFHLIAPGGGCRGASGRHEWAQVTAEDLRRMHWDQGFSTREIGWRYRVTYGCVGERMRALGVARRPIGGGAADAACRARFRATTDLEFARLYHEEDYSARDLARSLGVCRETIRRRMRAAGIPVKHRDYHKSVPRGHHVSPERRSAMRDEHLAAYRGWLEARRATVDDGEFATIAAAATTR